MSIARLAIVFGGLSGLVAVILAAMGAHAIPGMEDPTNYRAWQSASTIHLIHSVLLLVIGIRLQRQPSRSLSIGAVLLMLGIVLFSGSIYARVAFELERTFNLAPSGGLILMIAWVVTTVGLLRD